MKFFKNILNLFFVFFLFACGDRHVVVNMSNANLDKVETTNLSFREDWGRWTDGSPVQFKFIEGLPRNFVFTIKTTGAFGPIVGKNIQVVAGDSKQQFVAAADKQIIEMSFKNVSPGSDTVVIILPNPPSPKQLGLSDDARNLGIGIISVEVKPL
jgi:phosphoglycerol transferase